MYNVVVVKMFNSIKNKLFSCEGLSLKPGDEVVLNVKSNLLIGKCVSRDFSEDKDNIILPIDKVLRLVNEDDIKIIEKNNLDSSKALSDAIKFAKDLKLELNFVDSLFTFDRNQLILSFISDNRIDFRELAKKLAFKYKTRIELRQIGVRDKSKKIGGIGPCGLPLCCNSFLTEFSTVSINMAKNQFLALNPSKINGCCGRLLCCLGYENDLYTELKKGMPRVGEYIKTDSINGKVISVNLFKKSYEVDTKEGTITVMV